MSLHRLLVGYSLAASFTAFSIFFLDRMIAEFTFYNWGKSQYFEYFSHVPILFELLVAICLLLCIFPVWRKLWGKLSAELALTLLTAWGIRYAAKFSFGRTWPQTWKNNNLSWLKDGVEGFFPFSPGIAYDSFPSGHVLVTTALVCVLWRHFPRLIWLWVFCIILSAAGQLGQTYHYLGDVCAGIISGVLSAQLVALIMNYSDRPDTAR